MSAPPRPRYSSARRLAADILNRVCSGKHTLDYYLDQADARLAGLPRNERALAHALVLGVVRWQSRLDWIIDQLTDRPAGSVEPVVRTILRLGMFQLFHLDRIPQAAAVNTSVELTRQLKRPWAAGFVNKLLRRALNDRQWSDALEAIQDPVQAIATQLAFPPWLTKRWVERWGITATRQMCTVLNEVPAITLRTNLLKTSRAALMEALRPQAEKVEASPFTPEGVIATRLLRPMAQWPAFQEGLFQVQAESSQLVGHLLAPAANERIWDACAGLGTKTGHLAQLMGNKGFILASDQQFAKLRCAQHALDRLGVNKVSFCTIDLNGEPPLRSRPLFDRILLDAPCSGLGVLQKNPDGKWQTNPESLNLHNRRQLAFLKRCAPFLRPGGTLVYSVCSFEPEETELVVEEFLHDHPYFVMKPLAAAELNSGTGIFAPGPYMTILPKHSGLDGFFAAAMLRH